MYKKGNLVKMYNDRMKKIDKCKRIANEVNSLVGIKVKLNNRHVNDMVDKIIRKRCIEQLKIEKEIQG